MWIPGSEKWGLHSGVSDPGPGLSFNIDSESLERISKTIIEGHGSWELESVHGRLHASPSDPALRITFDLVRGGPDRCIKIPYVCTVSIHH